MRPWYQRPEELPPEAPTWVRDSRGNLVIDPEEVEDESDEAED